MWPHRWLVRSALVAMAIAAAFLVLPALAGVPARLVEGCGKWIATAVVLELLSAAGSVVLFKLVFGEPLVWRRSVPASLKVLGASAVLPAGGLLGPTVGAWSTESERPSLSQLTRSTTTFVILTSAPSLMVLVALGMLLWLGVPAGPHQMALTLVPATGGVALLTVTWFVSRSSKRWPASHRGKVRRWLLAPTRALSDGIGQAGALVRAADWKLAGALGYYAFDNAVLWAAFHAYGRTPPLGVVVMGYLVGSLAGALPLPAGLGAVDGGLVGALALYGAPAAPAAAAVLLYRGISLSLPIVLGAIGWLCSSCSRREGSRGAGVLKQKPPTTHRRLTVHDTAKELPMRKSALLAVAPVAAAVDRRLRRTTGSGAANGYSQAAPTKAAGAGPTVALAPSKFGKILVDDRGRTLYDFVADKTTASTCYGACASLWPPLTVSGTPKAGRGVSRLAARHDKANRRHNRGHLQRPPAVLLRRRHQGRPDKRARTSTSSAHSGTSSPATAWRSPMADQVRASSLTAARALGAIALLVMAQSITSSTVTPSIRRPDDRHVVHRPTSSPGRCSGLLLLAPFKTQARPLGKPA